MTLSADELFARYFLPLYPPAARKPAELARLRAEDTNPAQNPALFAKLAALAESFTSLAPRALGVAPEALGLDFTDASVHRLGAALTRERRDDIISISAAAPEPNPLAVFVGHAVAYVGECIVRAHGGSWQMRNPMWESLVRLESRAGIGDLAVFQWLLKSLADDEIARAPFGARYRTYVEVPTFDASKLSPIAPADRRVPRLARVRYDTLFKHLRAHLPELRDVGEHFPSPERLAELEFRWLDFALLGGGRMLLAHGPSATGVHLFWFDAKGFVKQLFYQADKFPEHVVRVHDDKGTVEVLVSIGGAMRVHEMLWWGA